MRINVWKIRALITFFLIMLIVILYGNRAGLKSDKALATWRQYPNSQQHTIEKFVNPPTLAFNLNRDRPQPNNTASISNNIGVYQPKYQRSWVHPTNFGARLTRDINGVPVNNQPLVVLHETVNSAASAINFFQTPHDDENTQASYHALITLEGTVIYLVPPEYRAFGAGNSVFKNTQVETVKTHPQFPPSVNNFAYHVALETPPDGRNNAKTHSGYTEAQYHSLAWLIAQSSVPDNRITTHRAVDRSGSRIDPRSFNFKKFLNLLQSYRQVNKQG